MKLILVFFGLSFFLNTVHSDYIQCYVCDNCEEDDLDDSMLQSCPPLEDTTTTPDLTATTTTKLDSTTTTPKEDTTTTTKLDSTTTSPKDDTSTTTDLESTTTTPEDGATTTTEVESTTTTPAYDTTTTTTTTTTEVDSTSTTPADDTKVDWTIAAPSATSSSKQRSFFGFSDKVPKKEQDDELYGSGKHMLKKRYIRALPTSSAAVSIQDLTMYLLRKYRGKRAVGNDTDGTSYHCYKVKINNGQRVQTNRGCVKVAVEESACQAVDTKYGAAVVEECSICSTGECNSGMIWTISLSVLSFTCLLNFVLN